jgi:hypothetical protein
MPQGFLEFNQRLSDLRYLREEAGDESDSLEDQAADDDEEEHVCCGRRRMLAGLFQEESRTMWFPPVGWWEESWVFSLSPSVFDSLCSPNALPPSPLQTERLHTPQHSSITLVTIL